MDRENKHPVLIIGAGISGLASAWYLSKAGIPFILFEKDESTGGMIQSHNHKGTTFDFGPNTIRDQTGNVRKLAQNLGLYDDMLAASEAFKTRFIVRNKALRKISSNPLSFLGSEILSARAKFRLVGEMFIASEKKKDESVGSFFERRLGKEAVDYIIDPIFSGIFAGNIYELSKETLLPKLAKFEEEAGSITWGSIRSKKKKNKTRPKVLSFKKGLQQLTSALEQEVSDHIIREEVMSLKHIDGEFIISTKSDSFISDRVISTIPSFHLARIMKDFDKELKQTLGTVPYAPILSTQVTYNRSELDELPEGFGFLVPRKENMRLLGTIWKSQIFPEMSGKGKVHFTLLTGGDSDHKIKSDPIPKIEKQILHEFNSLMNFNTQPEYVLSRLWKNAIPQFKVGYQKKKEIFRKAEEDYQGLYIGGNYHWGISIPDCINGAKECSERIMLPK